MLAMEGTERAYMSIFESEFLSLLTTAGNDQTQRVTKKLISKSDSSAHFLEF
jgi:hypothetical protein